MVDVVNRMDYMAGLTTVQSVEIAPLVRLVCKD